MLYGTNYPYRNDGVLQETINGQRGGDVSMPTTEQRFWSKVDVARGDSKCWEWEAYVAPGGYGRFSLNSENHKATRVAYELEHEDPGDDCVLHTCHNPLCVNPHHLYLGDRADNAADAIDAGQFNPVKGEEHEKAKLTADDVRDIRARGDTERKVQLAGEYDVSQHTINDIIKRRTWKHVEPEGEVV